MTSKSQLLFGSFALAAVLIRIPTFFPAVIDHDESTYLLIANQLLDGKIPYIDNIDIKPVGIYLWFALVLKIWNSIFAIRLFAALVIAISAYLICRIHFILFSYERVAIATGFLYIICASIHKWSWSANTEIFFQCCSLTSLYVLLISRRSLQFIFFGLAVGLGFLIKFHIAFDVIAFVIFYFFWQDKNWKFWLRDMVIGFMAFLVPLAILILIYWKLDGLDQLYFAMVTIPSGYSSDFGSARLFQFISEYYVSFAPIVLLLVISQWRALKNEWMMTAQWVLFLFWTITGWFGIAVTGKFFFHYYFQALPPMCLFALTWFMIRDDLFLRHIRSFIERRVFWIFGILVMAAWANQYLQVLRNPDITSRIYHTLKPDWRPGMKIYTNDRNILYYLLDTDPPTKYIHTSVLYTSGLIKAYQVDIDQELRKIVDNEQDYYVIYKEAHQILKQDIEQNYKLVNRFSGDVQLYARINR